MKVTELLSEDELGNLGQTLLLAKHNKMSRSEAAALAKRLQGWQFLVSNMFTRANLRWAEDKKTGTLRFISSEMPGSWRSGPAAVGRGNLIDLLRKHGFGVARDAATAARRETKIDNGPYIYFWGPGTPKPKHEDE